MRILITGANGFVARNLISALRSTKQHELMLVDRSTRTDDIQRYCLQADFVFHMAGVNRADSDAEFWEGNRDLTNNLLEMCRPRGADIDILFCSTTKALEDSVYGESKRAAEGLIQAFANETGARAFSVRIPNVFGKWCRPNYNSVVATFCHRVAHGEDITVHDRSSMMELIHIDDLVSAFLSCLDSDVVNLSLVTTSINVGALADTIQRFGEDRAAGILPDVSDRFNKALHSTYLSYLPEDQFGRPLVAHRDERGSFTEILRSPTFGQVSVNVSKPGIVKGDHWHHCKIEKFLVVSGKAAIRFRHYWADKVIEYLVDGDHPEVIDIPPGYTHHIENIDESELVTIIWANEIFDTNNPDTFAEKV